MVPISYLLVRHALAKTGDSPIRKMRSNILPLIALSYAAVQMMCANACITFVSAFGASGQIENQSQATEPDTSLTVQTGDMPSMEFVLIPAGTFNMGDPEYRLGGDLGHYARIIVGHGSVGTDDAGPLRNTTISTRFYLGRTKVTVAQYCAFLNDIDNPSAYVVLNRWARVSKDEGRYKPAEGMRDAAINTVPYTGAVAFCQWLNRRTGLMYRLPTEAEWEWAARGKEGRKYPWGNVFRADVDYGTGWQDPPASVDAFTANSTPEGIIGMGGGSIAEWCQDWYQDHYDSEDKIDPQGPAQGEDDDPTALRGKVMRGREAFAMAREWQLPTKGGVKGGFYSFRVVLVIAPSDDLP